MELRSVEELMDLLYAGRGAVAPDDPGPRTGPEHGPRPGPAGNGSGSGSGSDDLYGHALRTAALLRRRHPADKELQVAGLVHGIGRLLGPGAGSGPAGRAAQAAAAVRGLLGERVGRLVRERAADGDRPPGEDVLALRLAAEEARAVGSAAGVLEDWRTLLELVAARSARLGAVD
ncbi:hypothetical protein ACF061_23390 [Streptomyces sp. NPDC015220]|uniref:hypothetical protein n=1 Tax=Streptomyces sp. NPDC015220 TaxID=3364947 RepID=UPI0036FF4396